MTDNAQAWTVYNSLMVDPLTHTVYSAGEEVHLPEMEYQLLYYFLQHPGQTLSRKTLMIIVHKIGWIVIGRDGKALPLFPLIFPQALNERIAVCGIVFQYFDSYHTEPS